MTKAHSEKKPRHLTEAELELMTILWKLGEGTVNSVLEDLPSGRKLAYTSVSTILRILEGKKIVGSRKEGRGHVYFPKLTKADYEASTVKELVTKVFDGAPVAMVRQLLDVSDLSERDLKEIKRLLESKTREER